MRRSAEFGPARCRRSRRTSRRKESCCGTSSSSTQAAPPFPSRNVADNLADVAAQTAANRQGARDLLRLVERYSWPVVEAYMQHIRDAAERKTRAALAKRTDGTYRFTDHLDDGTPI